MTGHLKKKGRQTSFRKLETISATRMEGFRQMETVVKQLDSAELAK
jgi:hypothetical protein